MKKTQKDKNRWTLYVGIFAMLIIIVGVFSEPSSILQKTLFLLGSATLAAVAFLNRQRMLFALQIVIGVGSVLAFLELTGTIKYAVLAVASVLAIGYLIAIRNYKADPWSIVCTLGLILIAVGYVTDAGAAPLMFGVSLGLGGLLVALYSAIDLVYNKSEISAIWMVLNLIFAINPILMVSAQLG
ncbi:MAG: hypothetical protein V1827_05385 [Candidatus Micrarchaeota archaeon]